MDLNSSLPLSLWSLFLLCLSAKNSEKLYDAHHSFPPRFLLSSFPPPFPEAHGSEAKGRQKTVEVSLFLWGKQFQRDIGEGDNPASTHFGAARKKGTFRRRREPPRRDKGSWWFRSILLPWLGRLQHRCLAPGVPAARGDGSSEGEVFCPLGCLTDPGCWDLHLAKAQHCYTDTFCSPKQSKRWSCSEKPLPSRKILLLFLPLI